MQSFIDIAHNVLFCRPPLAEGRENEHDLDAGNSKVIDLKLVILNLFKALLQRNSLRDKTALIKKRKDELLRTDLKALCQEFVTR